MESPRAIRNCSIGLPASCGKKLEHEGDSPPDGDQQHLSDEVIVRRLQTTSRRVDPENVFLWRMNSRRMEAETVRDSLLSVAGQLDTTMGGPELEESQAEQTTGAAFTFTTRPTRRQSFSSFLMLPTRPIATSARKALSHSRPWPWRTAS